MNLVERLLARGTKSTTDSFAQATFSLPAAFNVILAVLHPSHEHVPLVMVRYECVTCPLSVHS
jgi:hypothetical protein